MKLIKCVVDASPFSINSGEYASERCTDNDDQDCYTDQDHDLLLQERTTRTSVSHKHRAGFFLTGKIRLYTTSNAWENGKLVHNIEKRPNDAILARENCEKSGSEWGVLYWESVYCALVKKFDRMN